MYLVEGLPIVQDERVLYLLASLSCTFHAPRRIPQVTEGAPVAATPRITITITTGIGRTHPSIITGGIEIVGALGRALPMMTGIDMGRGLPDVAVGTVEGAGVRLSITAHSIGAALAHLSGIARGTFSGEIVPLLLTIIDIIGIGLIHRLTIASVTAQITIVLGLDLALRGTNPVTFIHTPDRARIPSFLAEERRMCLWSKTSGRRRK